MKVCSLKLCAYALTLTHFLNIESKEYTFLIMCELELLLKGKLICIICKILGLSVFTVTDQFIINL